MPTLGEELKRRREERGITLAEIAEATRIGTRFLKAIETDNFSTLPGGLFTRSFIRAHAKHVGMNEDEAVGLYLQQVADPSVEQQETATQPARHTAPAEIISKRTPPSIVKPVTPAPERSRRFEPIAIRPSPARTNWPTIVIGGGIVVFIVIIVLALVKQLNQGSGESESQNTSVAQGNKSSKPVAQPSSSPSTQPGAMAEQPSTPASQVRPGQPLVVKLEAATGDVWIKYQVDDSKPTTLVLKRGQSQDLPPAQTQITLNYGNRMTLKLKINNRDASFPPDTPKFASHVVISRDNFQTYFP